MIGLSDLENIIILTLYSGYLQDEVPVSLLIVAEVEAGKSELAKEFRENDGVAFPHDITAFGIYKAYQTRILSGEIRHIIFPEFVHCLSRQKETVGTLIAFLNGLIAEGITEIHTYRTNFELPSPLSAGIIVCVTTKELDKWKREWDSSGFLSRLMPISYSYSDRIENQIFENLFAGGHSNHPPIKLVFPDTPRKIELPVNLSRNLNHIAREIGKTLDIRGFRPQINLQRLAKARALSQCRGEVIAEDILAIQDLALKYFNLDFKEIE